MWLAIKLKVAHVHRQSTFLIHLQKLLILNQSADILQDFDGYGQFVLVIS